MNNLLSANNLTKTFTQGGEVLTVLDNVQLRLEPGEMAALVGPSGAGKSTLLQILGLLDTPTSGSIQIAGQEVTGASDARRTQIRRELIGFVYQFHHLQPEFSALENVMLPQIIAGESYDKARENAEAMLDDVGLSKRLDHRPARLSGGEQQRVALARALANNPQLILADEPTGNLDPQNAGGVFELLIDRVRSYGISALVATHNMDLADQMDKILEIRNGRVMVL